MSSFAYNTVPIATNSPSVDQSAMLQNTNSIRNLINVDHIGFNANNGGRHKQVTLNDVTSQVLQSGNTSLIHSALGTINNTSAQAFFVNSVASFMLNGIRAFGYIRATGVGPLVPITSYGVATVNQDSAGPNPSMNVTVNLTAGVTTGTTAIVVSFTGALGISGTTRLHAISSNSFKLTVADNLYSAFIVMQN
jgi:hypothetical protein